ncbi:hypothetical protein CK489_15280 [Bradyrhizobium sp. UFLA03-84]|nr:hypothetical protein CK489_15280 [Bradyrhizobium sp. UFLA03-84]
MSIPMSTPTDVGMADAASCAPRESRPSLLFSFGPVIETVGFVVFMACLILLAASAWWERR